MEQGTHIIHISACPVCGAPDPQAKGTVTDYSVTQEVFSLSQCTDCGFLFTNPRPGPGAIGRYYASQTYISHTNAKSTAQEQAYQAIRSITTQAKYRLIQKHHSGGKVLDIGCGTGEFLGIMKRNGYQVTGVEPNDRARTLALENHSFATVPDLNQIPAQEQFDVLTMWHVLEHVHDLHQTAKALYSRAKKNATVLIAVPNRNSWDAQYYGAHWAAYDVPRHLSHFREEDIRTLLGNHGFVILSVRRMWFDAPYVAMLSERTKGRGQAIAMIMGAVIGAYSNLISALTGRPTSSTLYLARKA